MAIATNSDVVSGVQHVDCMINWREERIGALFTHQYLECSNNSGRQEGWRKFDFLYSKFLVFVVD